MLRFFAGSPPGSHQQQVQLAVGGMTCSMCATAVEDVLGKVGGQHVAALLCLWVLRAAAACKQLERPQAYSMYSSSQVMAQEALQQSAWTRHACTAVVTCHACTAVVTMSHA